MRLLEDTVDTQLISHLTYDSQTSEKDYSQPKPYFTCTTDHYNIQFPSASSEGINTETKFSQDEKTQGQSKETMFSKKRHLAWVEKQLRRKK